ncbi:precorrin-6A synthase (deacetylating) [Pseudomonas kermanshahensis]|uniref:Precorrin-6A synthase (Deacetylating) n=1 Tax=Pseudomonas kermanshahensis TaxID=2745482 RepID=A0ABU8R3S6_9PSED|nr:MULTISPECIES: precorrin-6A synthase (deacetylating) [Pseudomonas]MBC3497286.1 precorrin-6A synthase (deacetylating) [Pseudomonas sp. SWRI67]MBV4527575.1 precorrin-6A synthase (deacetylating) [Pseudomonas kermanshahensis]
MKDLLLIGIGPGDPRQVTYEAVDALRRASVFFVLDKGTEKDELVRLRKAILQRYRPEGGYRLVQVADPSRDGQALDYVGAVQDWHRQRAALYSRLIAHEIGADDVGAFLLWGEPGLYDSTLRMLDWVREGGLALRLQVIPGISSVQALAARHQVPLNRIGEPLTVLPGRRLAEQERIDNVVVMLDGQCAFASLDDPGLMIYWGAYLGTADEVLIAGPLQAVKAQILQVREEARGRKGWIMDTYLLRREL